MYQFIFKGKTYDRFKELGRIFVVEPMDPQPTQDKKGMWHWKDCQWAPDGPGFPQSGIDAHIPYKVEHTVLIVKSGTEEKTMATVEDIKVQMTDESHWAIVTTLTSLDPVDNTLSPRAKDLLFETLEMLRKELREKPDFENGDWKDVDDYLFSCLPFTQTELEDIYHGRNRLIFTGSAVR